ncbi:MAG: cytochrome c maturation protein CcmE domain-containing protein [Solirubrobacteraceae bacterium]
MDPSRKRAIRMTVALTAALLLATALVYTSFTAGRDELTASQLLKRARPGQSYILAGTVLTGSVRQAGTTLYFRVRDPKLQESVAVRYTGIVPDPFAAGRGVLVNVHETGPGASTFVGETDSLTTKCPSKYQAASGSYQTQNAPQPSYPTPPKA